MDLQLELREEVRVKVQLVGGRGAAGGEGGASR